VPKILRDTKNQLRNIEGMEPFVFFNLDPVIEAKSVVIFREDRAGDIDLNQKSQQLFFFVFEKYTPSCKLLNSLPIKRHQLDHILCNFKTIY